MSGFSFGTQTTQPQQSTPFVFSFGPTSTPSTTPSLFTSAGGGALSGTGLFGSSLTPATTSTGFFSGLSTTPTMTLSAPLTSATTAGGFPGLMSSTSLPSSGFTFGGFGTTTTAAPIGAGFGLGTPAVTTSAVGLGGVDFTQSSTGLGSGTSSGKNDSKAVKETLLPNEIGCTIESFKKYVKDQKVVREEISRVSDKPVLKVQEETAALKQLLSVVSNGLQRNALAIEKLKQESAQELKNAEIAQRTKDTPPSLQYENTAPSQYFQQLEANFEHQMQSYRKQIEQLEQHLSFVSQPSLLTPQDMTLIMKRLHGTFVALAAQLQTIHQLVQTQKEQFLTMHWTFQGGTTNIFTERRTNSKVSHEGNIPVTVGPAPFSHMPSPAAVAMASALNRTQQPAVGGPSSLTAVPGQSSITGGFGTTGLGTGLGTAGPFVGQSSAFGSSFPSFKPIGQLGTQPLFGSSSLGGAGGTSAAQMSTPLNNQKPFQLKPPPGNKRGKRWTST